MNGRSQSADRIGAARAYTNIALAKYWGKRHPASNLPAVPSLSATLDDLWTSARVEFSDELTADALTINGDATRPGALRRLSEFLDLVRERSNVDQFAQVDTTTNFPVAAGLASSASAFAALSMAACQAVQLRLEAASLSALARQGSGSAARSLFGGYVEIGTSDRPELAAQPVASASYLPLDVAVVVISHTMKHMSSRAAMRLSAETSPFYRDWVDGATDDFDKIRAALLSRDFDQLADRAEHNCVKMHAVAMTARPPILFWTGSTLELMKGVTAWRKRDNVRCFYTVDAGPNVVIFHNPDDGDTLRQRLAAAGFDSVHWTRVGGTPRLGPNDDPVPWA